MVILSYMNFQQMSTLLMQLEWYNFKKNNRNFQIHKQLEIHSKPVQYLIKLKWFELIFHPHKHVSTQDITKWHFWSGTKDIFITAYSQSVIITACTKSSAPSLHLSNPLDERRYSTIKVKFLSFRTGNKPNSNGNLGLES